MLRPTKILVPTDFSEYSDKALRQAIDIARKYKAKVYVLHVVQEKITRSIDDYGLTPLETIEIMEWDMINAARLKVEKHLDKFPHTKELEVISDVVLGNPSEAILEEEASKGIDLIVIASLGRTGLAKYLIGSVARNVLNGAKCPVLLTRYLRPFTEP